MLILLCVVVWRLFPLRIHIFLWFFFLFSLSNLLETTVEIKVPLFFFVKKSPLILISLSGIFMFSYLFNLPTFKFLVWKISHSHLVFGVVERYFIFTTLCSSYLLFKMINIVYLLEWFMSSFNYLSKSFIIIKCIVADY